MTVIELEAGERGLLSEQIRRALTDEITDGTLKPGTMLDESQLATRFGASRTPVREAIRELSAAGLVEIRPRRGIVVSPLDAERLSDLFEATAEVEAMCVRMATHRITAVERARLQLLHEESAAAVEAGDVVAYAAFNLRLHEAIYRATHNNFIVEHTLALRTRLLAFRQAQMRHGTRMQDSHREHAEILHAMARGDGDEAAYAMRGHMLNACGVLLRLLEEQRAEA